MISQVNCEVQNMVGVQIMVKDMTNQDTTAPADLSAFAGSSIRHLDLIRRLRQIRQVSRGKAEPRVQVQVGATGTGTGGLNGKM